jgi:hypothetical protein
MKMKIDELLDELVNISEDAEKLNAILPDAQLHSSYMSRDAVEEFRQFLAENKKHGHMENE